MPEPISAVSGLKFAILWGRVEQVLRFNRFFLLLICALVAEIWPDKVVRWCTDVKFFGSFYVLYFERAACSTF